MRRRWSKSTLPTPAGEGSGSADAALTGEAVKSWSARLATGAKHEGGRLGVATARANLSSRYRTTRSSTLPPPRPG